jgi:hypothetical protein
LDRLSAESSQQQDSKHLGWNDGEIMTGRRSMIAAGLPRSRSTEHNPTNLLKNGFFEPNLLDFAEKIKE